MLAEYRSVVSEMKSIPNLTINLPGVDVVCSPEGVARVQQITCVGDIHRTDRNGHHLPECLAHRKVERRVRRQVRRTVAIEKAGAELISGRRPGVARQGQREDGSSRVALIVIEQEVALRSV